MISHRRSRALILVLTSGLALAGVPWAGAQEVRATDFSTARLPISPVLGEIRFEGARAWVWREGPTQRLVLDRNVRVTLGNSTFEAERAVVWLRELEDGSHQVFAALTRVRTPSADAAVSVKADFLPIRAVIAGKPELMADVRLDGPPNSSGPVRVTDDIKRALAQADDALTRAFDVAPPPRAVDSRPVRRPRVMPEEEPRVEGPRPEPPVVEPRAERPPRTDRPVVVPPPVEETRAEPEVVAEAPSPEGEVPAVVGEAVDARGARATPVRSPLFTSSGIFFISAGERITVQSGEHDSSVVVSGGVVVQYQSGVESLELTAERAVIFLKPGKLSDRLSSFSADDVLGLYLEGEVRATDGTYTLRGPRIYYDVEKNRALVLDAVFWAYDARLRSPLYMRADAVRQESAKQFSAENAVLSNTAFFKPDFTIGVRSVTIERRESPEGDTTYVDAKNITFRAGDVPFFWWPRYRGDPAQFPLRSLGFEDSNRTGGVLTSQWDALSLLGIERPPGLDVSLELDVYFDRGLGLGSRTSWETERSSGSLYWYMLPQDTGTDILSRGTRVDRDGEFRGMAFLKHRAEIAENWTILAELSKVSDEAFVMALFPEIAREARELTSRVYARHTVENRQFTAELKGALDDFIIPEHQLQTPGYMVDKLPELRYFVAAADLLAETYPGLLTHTWEASYSHMRLTFSEVDARDLGFTIDRAAQQAFGTDADDSLGDLFRSIGLDEAFVNRFDTRHELSAQLRAGEVLITPFVVGRVTVYDDDFESFSPDETSNTRFWGGAGVTAATSFQRVYRHVESDLLDLHELRHIIEPSVTVWSAGTTIDREDLPIYDVEVESLLEGSAVQARLGQTFQTKRGGPGRWRSVDFLTFNAAYVWHSDDTGRTSAVGRFYSAQPELSVPGEYFKLDSTLQLTEAFGIAGETIYDLDLHQQARSSIGVLMQHNPEFATAVELRYLNPEDVTFGRLGMQYRLTDKYRLTFNTTYNFRLDDFQTFNVRFFRRFTIGELGLALNYDNIRGETSFGFTFVPFGASSGIGQRTRSTASDDGFGG